jgi:hypothetical protein
MTNLEELDLHKVRENSSRENGSRGEREWQQG